MFNLLVTSPPYGDNQTTVTYGQFSYLPLQWIPFEDIDESIELDYLKTTQEIDSKSLGGQIRNNIKDIEGHKYIVRIIIYINLSSRTYTVLSI